MTPNCLRHLVPGQWSAEQALLAVRLLEQAQDAKWQVHGDAMVDAIAVERAYADVLDLDAPLADHPDEDHDDEIPF